MSLIFYKFLAGFVILLTSLIAVIYPIKIRAHPKHHLSLELGDAFASGIFLGAALFHMLPSAIKIFTSVLDVSEYPLAELFCAGGFLVLLFLERLSELSRATKNAAQTLLYMVTFILIFHSLIEGAALGINTTFETTSILFLAIIAHKSSESFALAVILNRSSVTLKQIILVVSIFSVMTPLGIVLGTSLITLLQLKTAKVLTAGFSAFAAGTFLYMSTLHHINHHERQHDGESLLEFLFLLVGLVIMALLAGWT